VWHPPRVPEDPTTRRVLHCVLAALAVATLGPSRGNAHTLSYSKLVHVRFGPELIEVAVHRTVHAGAKARALRDRHDADRDGILDADEKRALAVTLDSEARSGLTVTVDGVALAPEVGVLDLDFIEDDGGEGRSLSLRSVAAVSAVLLAGAHRIEVKDRPNSPRATVPLRIEARGVPIERRAPDAEAMPMTPLANGVWLAGFTGEGGTVRFDLDVPPLSGPSVPSRGDAGAPLE